MNRNARRAAKAIARAVTVDRVTAVHEAGHAVGRLLTAEAMGIPFAQAVFAIEVGDGGTSTICSDDRERRSLATCYGPMLSSDMDAAYRIAYPVSDHVTTELIYTRIAKLGTPEQREIAAKARMLMIAMGPAAEARERGKPFCDVFASEECIGDVDDFFREVALLDPANEDKDQTVAGIFAEATNLVEAGDVWGAINDIARNIKGNLSGDRVAHLARRHLLASRLPHTSKTFAGAHL